VKDSMTQQNGYNRECDVLVVGAGPAGMRAAVEAADSGARVLVLDENSAPGGQIWRGGEALRTSRTAEGRQALRALARFRASKAQLLTQTRVIEANVNDVEGYARVLSEGSASAPVSQIRFRAIVLATGARERFLPFPGWTLPGVYGAGGLQVLAKSGFSVRGLRVVVAGSGPLLLAVATHLREAGANLVGFYEQASLAQLLPFAGLLAGDAGKLLQGAGYAWANRSMPLRTGCWPVAAHGNGRLESVTMTDGRRQWTIPCDALACGFHLVPNTELAQLLSCTVAAGRVEADAWGRSSLPGVFCAGELSGIGGLQAAETEGALAGVAAAARAAGKTIAPTLRQSRLLRERGRLQRFSAALARAFAPRGELRSLADDDTIVCRCEDVRYGNLHSYKSWREAKLQTRCGMGPCQGRICGAATQILFGWGAASVRPPLAPVPVSALLAAGEIS
jgi:NADPH-dependent 2,4-dienoyl-CoA reductase/sulfur reductase-like enzyme